MSRVANDTAWKRRVLKEEAIMERKNLALARTRLNSASIAQHEPRLAGPGGNSVHRSDSRQQVSRKTPSPSPSVHNAQFAQGLHSQQVESLRAPSARKFEPPPRPPTIPDDAQSVSSYSSGTSIQSYPSTRFEIQIQCEPSQKHHL